VDFDLEGIASQAAVFRTEYCTDENQKNIIDDMDVYIEEIWNEMTQVAHFPVVIFPQFFFLG